MKIACKLLSVAVVGLILCSFTGNPAATQSAETGVLITEDLAVGGAYLVFAGKFGGDVTKKQIGDQRKLGVDGCAKGSRIFSFTLQVTRSGKTKTFSTESNVLTTEMLAALKALQIGDSFNFKKTKAYLPNGKDVVDVHSREFTVV